jgi:hypothetical protein
LKKINASSDKKGKSMDHILPAETLWRAAQLIHQQEKEPAPMKAEPAPLEMLGLTIGILRRRKRISRIEFAQTIDCPVEELLALEMGLLPAHKLIKYLPHIVQQIKIPGDLIQPIYPNIKFA